MGWISDLFGKRGDLYSTIDVHDPKTINTGILSLIEARRAKSMLPGMVWLDYSTGLRLTIDEIENEMQRNYLGALAMLQQGLLDQYGDCNPDDLLLWVYGYPVLTIDYDNCQYHAQGGFWYCVEQKEKGNGRSYKIANH